MKQTISRTITFTTVNYSTVEVKDGQPEFIEQTPIKVAGKMTEEKAVKYLEKEYGKDIKFIVTSLETDSGKYEMTLNTFIENAEKIETNQEEK